jgi:hypothetical protein
MKMRGCQSSARFPSTLTLPLTLMKGEATRAAFSAYYLCERYGRINQYCRRNPFENLFARQTRFDLIN